MNPGWQCPTARPVGSPVVWLSRWGLSRSERIGMRLGATTDSPLRCSS